VGTAAARDAGRLRLTRPLGPTQVKRDGSAQYHIWDTVGADLPALQPALLAFGWLRDVL